MYYTKGLLVASSLWLFTSCTTLNIMPKPTVEKENKLLILASQYAKDGLLKEALSTYKKALAKEPRNLSIHRNLGILYVKIGDYKKASRHLEKSHKGFKNNFESNFYLAEAYRAREKLGKAIYRYNRALEIRPKSIKTLKALAWSYYKVRFYSEALLTIRKLNKLAPNDHQATIISARTLVKLGRFRKALNIIKKGQTLAKKGDLPFLLSVEGDLYLKLGRISRAEKTYRAALKEQPLLAGALLGLSKCLMQSGKESKRALAIEYLERAVRIKPKMTEALYLLVKHYEASDPSKSRRYGRSFKKYAATDPEFQKELLEIRTKKVEAPNSNSNQSNLN